MLKEINIPQGGPELIFEKIHDHIGFHVIEQEMFRHLIRQLRLNTIRLYFRLQDTLSVYAVVRRACLPVGRFVVAFLRCKVTAGTAYHGGFRFKTLICIIR